MRQDGREKGLLRGRSGPGHDDSYMLRGLDFILIEVGSHWRKKKTWKEEGNFRRGASKLSSDLQRIVTGGGLQCVVLDCRVGLNGLKNKQGLFNYQAFLTAGCLPGSEHHIPRGLEAWMWHGSSD